MGRVPCVEVGLTARSLQVTDGPNDQGEMFLRAAKLSDKLPAPYANESVSLVTFSDPL